MAEVTRPKKAKAGRTSVNARRRSKIGLSRAKIAENTDAGGPGRRGRRGISGRADRPDRPNVEVRTASTSRRLPAGGTHESSGKLDSGTDRVRQRREWRNKILVGAPTIITAAVGIWLASWLVFFAGPGSRGGPSHSPPVKPIVDPGHLPGRLDVSTMTPRRRFYAVPNFYYFQSCGRPCWLPLYELPTEQSAFVTDGWPCEYYGPNHSSAPSCLRPPAGRTPLEMADPGLRTSGDRLWVLCQTTHLATGVLAQTIRNQVGQSSDIWDMVALPSSHLSPDSPASGLAQVPGMRGFYEAFAPDIWLGNTGWHYIACT